MFIRLIHIEPSGFISNYAHHNQEVWYSPGDTIDTKDFTHFEIQNTSWGDYSGCTVTRSNHRCLIKILDEEKIEYFLKTWAYWTHTIYIPIKYLGHEVLDDVIKGLDDYPCIDDEDMSNLECELTEEYFDDRCNRWDFKLQDPDGKSDDDIFQDYMQAYHHLCETGSGEGLIFETGCVPYLGDEKRKIMREYLINKLGYQPE